MTTRNFEFRISPRNGERAGRYILDPQSDPLPQGVPVVTTGEVDSLGRSVVTLADPAADKPAPGQGGILVYEQFRYDGVDPVINTYSDMDTVPPGKAVQVVTGENRVRIAYRNTTQDSFLIRSGYPHPRIMIAGVSIATPTVAPQDFLTPGAGDDDDGYWAETADATKAWLVVNTVDSSTGWVEVTVNF